MPNSLWKNKAYYFAVGETVSAIAAIILMQVLERRQMGDVGNKLFGTQIGHEGNLIHPKLY